MQLIIKNAKLRGKIKLKDIFVNDGKINSISDATKEHSPSSEKVIDAQGSLTTSTLTCPHIHLDKALIGQNIVNKSGNLWEAIQKTWEYKKNYTTQDIIKRASEIIETMIGFGTTRIRTHVDVDPIGGLLPVEAMLEVKEIYSRYIDFSIVAFPQEGIIKSAGTKELLEESLKLGVDTLGGMPHYELDIADSFKHIDFILDLASKYNVPIDAHVDETDDPNSKTLEALAAVAIKRKFSQKITVGHICALSAYNNYHAARVIELVAEAGISVITNPPTNMVLQGRGDTCGGQRVGITRVKELLEAGILVSVGQDCIKDPYYPFGNGDMLAVANLTAHAAKMTLSDEIDKLYDFITCDGAEIMGKKSVGIEVGNRADFLIYESIKNVWEAIRKMPIARCVIKNGKIIAETSSKTRLMLS